MLSRFFHMCIEGVPSRGTHCTREERFHTCQLRAPRNLIWRNVYSGRYLCPEQPLLDFFDTTYSLRNLFSGVQFPSFLFSHGWDFSLPKYRENHYPFREFFSSSQSEVDSSTWSDHFQIISHYCPYGREHTLTLMFYFLICSFFV